MSTDRKDGASSGALPSLPLQEQSNFSRPLSFGLQSSTTTTITAGNPATEEKGKKRFWSLRKKKDDPNTLSQRRSQSSLTSPSLTSAPTSAPVPAASSAAMSPTSPLHSPGSTTASTSPNRLSHKPLSSPSSPGRQLYSPAQRPLSTASSQIFERNVQEDVASAQLSPAIPAHIITENHIPPVLEASSEAITDSHLDPDSVEIVTHGSHQPASAAVSGGLGEHSLASSFYDDASATASAHPLSPPPPPLSSIDGDETAASNYGNLDAGDIRRLSFISFADVVHAEHAESHADLASSGYLGGAVSPAGAAGYTPSSAATARGRANRSPSPIRSPVSSHGFSTSPPTSASPSFKGLEVSPVRAPTGTTSPLLSSTTAPVQPKPLNLSPAPTASPPLSAATSGQLLSPGLSPGLPGDLQVETMRQILRRSGSQDFSVAKAAGSQPLSNAGSEDCDSGAVKAP